MAFLIAVKEEYRDLFRKFVRPSSAAFWDCVVEIYKRYIMSQILPHSKGNSRKPSLCYPEMQIPSDIIEDSSIAFYNPSFLSGARESTIQLQKVLRENVRWKTKTEIFAETSLKNGILQEKKKQVAEETEVPVGWFSGWVTPKPVEVDYNSDLDRIAHGTDLRSGKSSRFSSKRINCMSCGISDVAGEICVAEYILLRGHDSIRPEVNLFDDLVNDVTVWLNSKDAEYH